MPTTQSTTTPKAGSGPYKYPISPEKTTVGRIDQGVDFAGAGPIFAIGNAKVLGKGQGAAWATGGGGGNGDGILYQLLDGPKSGSIIYIYEGLRAHVSSGQVTAGQHIGDILGGSASIEMGWANASGTPTAHGHYSEGVPTPEGRDFNTFLLSIKNNTVVNSGNTVPGDTTRGQNIESIAKAAAFSTFLDLPGFLDQAESLALTGERSLMNDQPLLPFIQQLCQASLRNFQSMPNGNFFAFYPDYFGGLNHRTPYWEIADIEIRDGKIDLSDDALVTHMYVVGDTATFSGMVTGGGNPITNEITTAGIVNVFNAFMADFMNGVANPALKQASGSTKPDGTKLTDAQYQKEIANIPTLADKAKATAFLQKYGARPLREDAPMIRSHFFEMFLAYQKFCLMWAQQFITTFEFTFMPELFPGGIVSFPEHGIQCYVDEVRHECNYETGFITRANLSAPSALRDKDGKATGSRTNINEGMIRAGAFSSVPGGTNGGTPQAAGGRNTG